MLLFLTDVVLNLVPAYSTYIAVVRPSPEATKTWLTFWVVHTIFSIAELFLDVIAFWLPAYQLAKVLLVLWMVFWGGAGVLYNTVVQRLLEQYEDVIDEGLNQMQVATAASALHWAKTGLSKLNTAGPAWLATAGALAGGQVDAMAATVAADVAGRRPVGALQPADAIQQRGAPNASYTSYDAAPEAGDDDSMPAQQRFEPTLRRRNNLVD